MILILHCTHSFFKTATRPNNTFRFPGRFLYVYGDPALSVRSLYRRRIARQTADLMNGVVVVIGEGWEQQQQQQQQRSGSSDGNNSGVPSTADGCLQYPDQEGEDCGFGFLRHMREWLARCRGALPVTAADLAAQPAQVAAHLNVDATFVQGFSGSHRRISTGETDAAAAEGRGGGPERASLLPFEKSRLAMKELARRAWRERGLLVVGGE